VEELKSLVVQLDPHPDPLPKGEGGVERLTYKFLAHCDGSALLGMLLRVSEISLTSK